MPSRCATPSSSGSRRTALAVLLLAAAAAAEPAMRLVISPRSLTGYMRARAPDSVRQREIDRKRAQLDYYRDLGFTHVAYCLDDRLFGLMARENGAWRYHGGRYRSEVDSSFWAMKREVESRGMRLVPQIASLSHMDASIVWLDSTVSEFASWGQFDAFAAAKGLPRDRALNHVASAADNPAADQIIGEQLKIFLAGWGRTPLGGASPGIFFMGHDELGFDSVCFVKAGRNRDHPATRSQLVAGEIARRVAQIDSLTGARPRILLCGDSFLPTDVGEAYGLVGDASGRGGVLQILRDVHGLAGRILIIPWAYHVADGERHYWSRLPYDKGRQLAYLDAQGFGYVLGTGEHGSNDNPAVDRFAPPFALGYRAKTVQCLTEWILAARRYPRMLRGYAHASFEPFDLCAPDGSCSGFTAPVLAYLAWSGRGGTGGALAGPGALDRVDYLRSRKERRWTPGIHYPGP